MLEPAVIYAHGNWVDRIRPWAAASKACSYSSGSAWQARHAATAVAALGMETLLAIIAGASAAPLLIAESLTVVTF